MQNQPCPRKPSATPSAPSLMASGMSSEIRSEAPLSDFSSSRTGMSEENTRRQRWENPYRRMLSSMSGAEATELSPHRSCERQG